MFIVSSDITHSHNTNETIIWCICGRTTRASLLYLIQLVIFVCFLSEIIKVSHSNAIHKYKFSDGSRASGSLGGKKCTFRSCCFSLLISFTSKWLVVILISPRNFAQFQINCPLSHANRCEYRSQNNLFEQQTMGKKSVQIAKNQILHARRIGFCFKTYKQ